MYRLAGALDDVEVAPGSNLLVLGPAMAGKQRLAHDVLAAGAREGEASIIVSTSDGARHVIRAFEDALGDDGPQTPPLGIIDCVTRDEETDELDTPYTVRYASSPVDMTGIGIHLSELLEDFHEDRGIERNRVVLDNISTMLMYTEVQPIFRFLHVFTGRVQNVDGLGLYLVDPSAHDEQTVNTLKGLFDGLIETDGPEARFTYTGARA